MSCCALKRFRARVGLPLRVLACAAMAVAFLAVAVAPTDAQIGGVGGGFIGRAVGGVSIDAAGVLANAEQGDLAKLQKLRAEALQKVPEDLAKPNELRKVSLRGLALAVADCLANNRPLPDDVKYLAGLQHVKYVFVYPEQNDVVLVGFGEGWKIGPSGTVTGVTTGRPVLLLDDLAVALRSTRQAAQGGISCSIDQNPEGLRRLNEALQRVPAGTENPQAIAQELETLAGPQPITVAGVPATSHFARVLVAADYRMKRLGQGFDPSPVQGLPSYLEMARPGSGGIHKMMPRWWMTTDYDPLLTDADGLAWELRSRGVKCVAEDDLIADNGGRKHTGKVDKISQRWADNMTTRYDQLALHDPIFGELRNCMLLAIVAALIDKEGLADRAGCDLSPLTSPDELPLEEFVAPKEIAPKAIFLRKGSNWMMSVSGGVQIHSWGIADRKEATTALAPLRDKTKPAANITAKSAWRWN